MINTVHLLDNMIGMAETPDKFYDLAVVNPPYGIGAPKQAATPCQRKAGANRLNQGSGKLKDRKLNNSNCEWDNSIPNEYYFNEVKRISKNQIIWGGNYFPLPPTRCVICWDKMQPWENFSQWEMAWTSFDSPARLFQFDNRTGDKIHPTQKPVALYDWIFKNYLPKGGKVLDTHVGSGSSRIAAYKAGNIDFTGYELDEDYHRDQESRFRAFVMNIAPAHLEPVTANGQIKIF